MRLRPATPQDAPACAAILTAFVAETPWMPALHSPATNLAYVEGLIEAPDIEVIVAEDQSGFAALQGTLVWQLQVAAAARRRGLGSQLIAALKDRTDHLALWCFVANRPARAFYEKQGFVETARTGGENEEGLPDIRLEWRRG